MKKEMLINVLQPEECRIAILEDGVLEELYVERTGHESYVGNIYKGKIVNIEPTYWRHLESRRNGERGDRGRSRDRDRDRDQDRGGRDHDRGRLPAYYA